MSVIIGDEETKKRVRDAKAGDPTVYVNFEMIEMLPEQFQAIISAVEFNKEKDFTPIGSKYNQSYYPQTKLMYEISEKRGITSYGESIVEPIEETVNISLMEMSDTPFPLKKKTGYMVKKQGAVIQEDGSMRTCPQRIGISNAWEDAETLWNKEEAATEGYTKTVTDKYGTKGYETEWNGKKDFHALKYDTKWKRRASFQDLMDKAMGMADTTAWLKVIRELAGLKTGYTDADLAEGKFYFAKIVKSSSMLKAEAAARLTALSHGIENNASSRALFGPSEPAAPEPRNVTPDPVAPATPAPVPPPPAPADLATAAAGPVDQRLELIRVLAVYDSMKLVDASIKETFDKMSAWLQNTPDATGSPFWAKAMGVLTDIENAVPTAMRISGAVKR